MPILKRFGTPRGLIANYMKFIEQNLIPSINQSLGTSINNYPSISRETYATYNDDINKAYLEVSSNYRDLEGPLSDNKGNLFVNVGYKGKRNEAGIISTKDLFDAVDKVHYAFNEIGYYTPEEKEKKAQEKAAEEEKKKQQKAEEERKRKERADLDDELDRIRQAEEERNQPSEEEQRAADEREYQNSQRPEVLDEVNNSIDYIAGLPGQDQTIKAIWNNPVEDTKKWVELSVTLTHVAGNNFYLENNNIKPKIQKVVNSTQASDYIMKISDKMLQPPVVLLADERGRRLSIPKDSDNGVDLGIDI